MRFEFDKTKSNHLRKNLKRGIGFEEVQEIFHHLTMKTVVPMILNSLERLDGWKESFIR